MRPSKDQYYLNIAKEVAQRSTCFRVRIGAIIVKNDVIVATGYVGAPRKTKDCLERGECLRDKLRIPHGRNYEICRSVHAEQNCVSGNSLTVLPTGEIKEIKKVNSPLLVLNTQNFKIQVSEGKKFEEQKKKVIKIITTGNHEIEVSPDHLMFVADESKILKIKKAKDLTLNDLLPFVAKIRIQGTPQFLPEVPFSVYKLNQKGREIFQKILREITWRGLAKQCGFSIRVIANLRKGKGIRKENKEKITKFFPKISFYFEGIKFHQVKIPSKTTPDFCQIAGYFLGDGSVGKRYIAFYDQEKSVLKFYQNLCKKVFNLRGSIKKRKEHWQLTLCSYRLSLLFEKLDFRKRKKRKVPLLFHRVPEDSLASFLRGFADAEGTVEERSVHLSSCSKQLLEEIKLLFLRFGIIPALYSSENKRGFEGYRKSYSFSLEITGEDLKVFYEKIGFSHPAKRRKLKEIIKARKGKRMYFQKIYFKEWFRGDFSSTYFPLVRDYKSKIISRESAKKILRRFERFGYNRKNLPKLKNLVENIVFLKIKKIEKLKKRIKMIDYFVPKFHSFLVNGFIVHNCIINAARSGVSVLGGDMYIWGSDREGKLIDVFPCFICKKMIINAGLKRVICATKEGDYRIFNVEDWVKDWQENDILDDKFQYGKDLNEKEGFILKGQNSKFREN